MDDITIKEAMKEAKEFIERAKAVLERRKIEGKAVYFGCKETGALRRKSMDLTRALARLRKNRWGSTGE